MSHHNAPRQGSSFCGIVAAGERNQETLACLRMSGRMAANVANHPAPRRAHGTHQAPSRRGATRGTVRASCQLGFLRTGTSWSATAMAPGRASPFRLASECTCQGIFLGVLPGQTFVRLEKAITVDGRHGRLPRFSLGKQGRRLELTSSLVSPYLHLLGKVQAGRVAP